MFLFGVIDNLVLWACLMAGLEFSDYVPVPRKYRCKAVGATIGALVGNAVSDGIAGLPQGFGPAGEVFAGCVVVLVLVPFGLRRLAGCNA